MLVRKIFVDSKTPVENFKTMKLPTKLFPILAIICMTFNVYAQQSSKTKAANKLYEKGSEVQVVNTTKINTPNLEFSPAYYQNGIVFVTSSKKEGKKDKNIKEAYFELFYADLDANGLPMEPREFSVQLNTTQHEGPVTFDRQGKVLYFTSNNSEAGSSSDSDGPTRLKIYEAKKGC